MRRALVGIVLEVNKFVNRDRTDRIPNGDDLPDEGAGRPRRDRRPGRLPPDVAAPSERHAGGNSLPWDSDSVDLDSYIDERAEERRPSRATRRPAAGTAPGAVRTGDTSTESFFPPSASARSSRRRDTDAPWWTEESDRGRSNRPADLPHEGGSGSNDNDEEVRSAPPPPRPRSRRTATRSRSRGIAPPALSLPRPRVPSVIAHADLVNDPLALALVGVGAFGLLVMATVMGNRLDALPGVVELRFDAAGVPYRWGVPRTLWNLPLLATVITLMNLAVAWFVSPHDRFASRFCVAAALVVQLLVWVPVIRFLW